MLLHSAAFLLAVEAALIWKDFGIFLNWDQ